MPLYKLSYLVLPDLPSNDFFSKILNNLAYKRLLTISYSIDMINEGFFLIFSKALDLF
jgi:predicted CoA-binding protein